MADRHSTPRGEARAIATASQIFDQLDELSWMIDAADALVDDVVNCTRAHETQDVSHGPTDGLVWVMTQINAKMVELKAMAAANAAPGRKPTATQ